MKNNNSGLRRWFVLTLLLLLLAAAGVALVIDHLDIPPRQLAPYLQRRAEGHDATLTGAVDQAAALLQRLDRGVRAPYLPQRWTIGAQPRALSTNPAGTVVLVNTTPQLRQALAVAQPGQVITLMPGHYRVDGDGQLALRQAGRADAPITVRAEQPETAFLEFNAGEGFNVQAPWWVFENLHIQGVCRVQEFCEHAFHVVGRASHFAARNNTIVDFNAHFKINGEDGRFPDDGVIEGNTLTNTSVRQTDVPVTSIDLVAASRWRIARNIISDFIKARGDQVSYGAFVKGGGAGNRIEQNIILCEYMLQGAPGQRVGLSLGGGGTGPQYCRDRPCITEQDGGVIQSNLVASCSDDGIYLNSAAASHVLHNTLVDTGGITVRFAASTADVQGNLVDSVIRARDQGLLRADENLETGALQLFLGRHPVRALFRDSAGLDFAWASRPPTRELDAPIPDLCGKPRTQHASYGAFEEFPDCARLQQN